METTLGELITCLQVKEDFVPSDQGGLTAPTDMMFNFMCQLD